MNSGRRRMFPNQNSRSPAQFFFFIKISCPNGGSGKYDKGVLHIPQSSSITRHSPSDCLTSYLGHSLWGLTPLQRSSRCILRPHSTGQESEWTWEQWQLKSTLHFPNLKDEYLAIRWFNVISRTLVGGVLPL